jgi:segregation and condensation protein A
MSRILRRLQAVEYIEFSALFDATAGVPMLVVSFLAVLELVKERLALVSQQEAYAPIYVRLNQTLHEETDAESGGN